jgi:hypothetical protein
MCKPEHSRRRLAIEVDHGSACPGRFSKRTLAAPRGTCYAQRLTASIRADDPPVDRSIHRIVSQQPARRGIVWCLMGADRSLRRQTEIVQSEPTLVRLSLVRHRRFGTGLTLTALSMMMAVLLKRSQRLRLMELQGGYVIGMFSSAASSACRRFLLTARSEG